MNESMNQLMNQYINETMSESMNEWWFVPPLCTWLVVRLRTILNI